MCAVGPDPSGGRGDHAVDGDIAARNLRERVGERPPQLASGRDRHRQAVLRRQAAGDLDHAVRGVEAGRLGDPPARLDAERAQDDAGAYGHPGRGAGPCALLDRRSGLLGHPATQAAAALRPPIAYLAVIRRGWLVLDAGAISLTFGRRGSVAAGTLRLICDDDGQGEERREELPDVTAL